LSTFQPSSAVALRNGLFHSPETIAILRGEAADRFLRWREVEKSVERISRPRKRRVNRGVESAEEDARATMMLAEEKWDKTKWEAEWMADFSRDVDSARRKREATITQKDVAVLQSQASGMSSAGSTDLSVQNPAERRQTARPNVPATVFDPLHLPSLLAFSVSLLGPLGTRLERSVREVWGVLNETQVRVALVGGFCVGFGVGIRLFVQS
jgi:hypothetical protein